MGFCSAGIWTPGSRVHGKFSIHEPCEATGSISWTRAQVFGAFHQSCTTSRQSGWSAVHSGTSWCTAPFPPCPFTTRMRRNPLPAMPSRTSRTTARCVETRREMVPG